MASIEMVYGNPQVIKGIEGTTGQVFKAGDPLKTNAGKWIIATDGVIKGIARGDASAVEGTALEVELIDPSAVYSVRYKVGATAQTLVGSILDFNFAGTLGDLRLDESGAATDVYCVALDSRDAVLTSGGRLLVRFLGALLT